MQQIYKLSTATAGLFQAAFVGYAQFPTALFAAAGNKFSAILRFHALAKPVGADALDSRGLVGAKRLGHDDDLQLRLATRSTGCMRASDDAVKT